MPFKEFIPSHIQNKISKGSSALEKQFCFSEEETISHHGFVKHPVEDHQFQKGKILHKYFGRALLLCSNNCAMHCRFCFRKFFKHSENYDKFDEEIKYLKETPSISELILSGGDPLSLLDSTLEKLFEAIEEIPHIQRIRIHSRYIIGVPSRISEKLITIFQNCSKPIFFILHTNHVDELDEKVLHAIRKLQNIQIPIMTQTVLLKGINDSYEDLKSLFETLINHKIIPYYLHQLDQVEGSHHFYVPKEIGLEIHKKLKESLPGYAVPKYVQEIPFEKNKTEIIKN
ncbi:MAG TPA: KamA family radical SAM protein [Chlamydiales bacterium]|nr:KamA family radical SAM protein [Chlamydiales bacterium]